MPPKGSFTETVENKFLRAFLEEAEELLEKLNSSLLELEKDRSNTELVHEIFRLTHSLKSESALLGCTNLSELAHRLEDVFENIRNGNILLSKPLMDIIYSGSDLIHEMVARISRGESDRSIETHTLIAELERFVAYKGSFLTDETGDVAELQLSDFELFQAQEAQDREDRLYQLNFHIDADASMKYPRAYLVFNRLEMLANVIKTEPEMVEPLENDELYSRVSIFFSTDIGDDKILKTCEVDQIKKVELKPVEYSSLLSRERKSPGEINLPGEPDIEVKRGRIEKASIRVETRKLNDLWLLVGDLINCKAHLSLIYENQRLNREQLKGELETVADSLERITEGMQQAMMETRMVPISVLFNKFTRLVRDLSRKLAKVVDLEIYGKETEIDRSIIEVLSDPLTHIIRNALDHGIESSEERLREGKSERGTIMISAQQQGGKIVIEIDDDGRGLDIEKIRKRADAEKGMSDEEVIDLIFTPGFSTRDTVTDLSGRGVGMDVVATRIKEELKGDVIVKSEKGMGTKITILLPLTLTILHSLVIRSGQHYYAIPIRDIDETIKVAAAKIQISRHGEIYIYSDGEITLLRLETLLSPGDPFPGGGSITPSTYRPSKEAFKIGRGLLRKIEAISSQKSEEHNGVIINQKGRKVCLLVDELVEEEDVVIKPIADILNFRNLFSGVSVLGDGRILFILDTARIVEYP